MKTYTTLKNLFTTLSNNKTSTNEALGGQLISDQHRYLIQKYFDNERTYTTVTVGGQQDLSLLHAVFAGATSATLSVAWPNATMQQLVVFSNGEQRTVFFNNGGTSISWQVPISDNVEASIDLIGQQAYSIPANVSKIKNDTITVGQLVYTPAPVQSIQEWTLLNALPYTSDIPNYFYIYNNQVMFWPIPSTDGNIITFNYKARVPDLSFSDISTGGIANAEANGYIVDGASNNWDTIFPLGVDISFLNLFLRIPPPYGDGIWYPIQQFNSAMQLQLLTPIQNQPSSNSPTYVIGQLPLLQEDFHDMLVYGALKLYYSSTVQDDKRYKQYSAEYQTRLDLLEAYAGTKSVNVDLGAQPIPNNPNLFIYANQNN